MNYDRIKYRCEEIGLSIRKLCQQIGISDAGYYKMIENKSFKVETLEKMAVILQVSVTYFFDNSTNPDEYEIKSVQKDIVSDTHVEYKIAKSEEDRIQVLLKHIKKLKSENDNLKKRIDTLQNRETHLLLRILDKYEPNKDTEKLFAPDNNV
jgi:transcriptional regulator with XRE-family HTH domain